MRGYNIRHGGFIHGNAGIISTALRFFNLSLVKSPKNDGFNFSTFYGTEQIYEIPESIKDDREQSNRIVTKKDKKGGWVYDEVKGTISPNI